MALTRKAALELLENGYLTQEQYDRMFADGIVKSSTRTSRPQVHVPQAYREQFQDKVYDAMIRIAQELGFDYTVETENSGLATLYLKGAGKPRKSKNGEDDSELI